MFLCARERGTQVAQAGIYEIYVLACMCQIESKYVIYKPRLQGVFNKYMTRVRGQRKFISGKLPMTEDEGRVFVEYTE